VSHADHRAASPRSVACFVLTVSDTRTEATDASGQAIADLLAADGHRVAGRQIVADEPRTIRAVLDEQLASSEVSAVIVTGGTGISGRDGTYEVVTSLIDKAIDGFGELFRMLSYQEIGAAAMLSRACAGTSRGRIVIALPGSEHAVRLAMTKLILPELGHMVREVER
jgi:molybdenum cofactor biosynthesis protein B